jgi:Fe2+ transport system protein B
VAVNKIDAGPVPAGLETEVGEPVLGISATEGTELDALTDRLTKLVETAAGTVAARQMVTYRQAAELTIADRALGEFISSAATAPADVLAVKRCNGFWASTSPPTRSSQPSSAPSVSASSRSVRPPDFRIEEDADQQ